MNEVPFADRDGTNPCTHSHTDALPGLVRELSGQGEQGTLALTHAVRSGHIRQAEAALFAAYVPTLQVGHVLVAAS